LASAVSPTWLRKPVGGFRSESPPRAVRAGAAAQPALALARLATRSSDPGCAATAVDQLPSQPSAGDSGSPSDGEGAS
jgi:hypothetical protein